MRVTDLTEHGTPTRDALVIFLIYALFYLFYPGHAGEVLLPHWDAEIYLNIAQHGYGLERCSNGTMLCGNVGWFPLWPVFVRLISGLTFVSIETVFRPLGVLMALAFFLLLGRVSVKYADPASRGPTARVALILTACFPAGFYFLTGFPNAFLLVLQLSYLLAYDFQSRISRTRNAILLFLGLAISATYPIGFLFAIVPGVHELRKRRLARVALLVFPFAAGMFLYFAFLGWRFGDFFLYSHAQAAQFHRALSEPLTMIWNTIFHGYVSERAAYLWYLPAIAIFWDGRKRIPIEIQLYGLALFLFPAVLGNTASIYRYYTLLFPIVLMIAVSRRHLRVKLAFAAVGLALTCLIFLKRYLENRLI